MNKRIEELAEKAGFSSWVIHPSKETMSDTPELLKKFAELIVRECAKFLEENSGYDDSNNAWHPEAEDLLKHFGVE